MPTNLTKKYNEKLDLLYTNHKENIASIRKVFDRDIADSNNFKLKDYPIYPTSAEGEDKMDRLFRHLTTVVTDKQTRKREFDSDRSVRVHWIRHHIDNNQVDDVLLFNMPDEKRTYILDKKERYVIIFEQKKNNDALFLLTAYHLGSSNFRGVMKKYENRGKDGIF